MTNCTRCGGIASPACDHGPCQFAPVKGEREAFEAWAYKEWEGRTVPHSAWLGWQARAASDTGASRDALDAARWRFAIDWETKGFAVCYRDEDGSWTPIKNGGPIDAARASLAGTQGDGA